MPSTQQRERFLESTLEQLCEEADAKHQRDDPRIERVRRLLADDVSLERAWHELNTFKDRAAASTVEALMFSLSSGAGALARPDVRHRLSQLNKEQLCEVAARLLKFTAAGWTEADIEDQHVGRPWIRRRNNAPRRPSIARLATTLRRPTYTMAARGCASRLAGWILIGREFCGCPRPSPLGARSMIPIIRGRPHE
jgi:hypothetical protein